jgi:hypothetical protein
MMGVYYHWYKGEAYSEANSPAVEIREAVYQGLASFGGAYFARG